MTTKAYIIIPFTFLACFAAVYLGFYTKNFLAPAFVVMLLAVIIFLFYLFKNPVTGLYTLVGFMFFTVLVGREGGAFTDIVPTGTLIEILLVLTLLSIWYNAKTCELSNLKTDLFYFWLAWFVLSVAQIANPAGASLMGWLQEFRSAAFQPLTITIIGLILINTRQRANNVIKIMIISSVIATLYGMRQHFFGLTAVEQDCLDSGAAKTHLLFGKLRVFSFYTDAGQFGASQAQFAILCIIFAIGFSKWSKKLMYLVFAGLSIYGMLISGTRGALFAFLAGAFVAVLATKKIKFIAVGFISVVLLVAFLKFTTIGDSNYNIWRMRSALNSDDPSLNVRFNTQKVLRDYMKSYPFGGGLGVIGAFGVTYNSDKFLSQVQPDSYWVKVWAMYGIVGLLIFFCGWMYLIGKSFGILWRTRDKNLRVFLTGMLATVVGLFVCSYGNEVMNGKPSVFVIHLALVIIFMSPRFDIDKNEQQQILNT